MNGSWSPRPQALLPPPTPPLETPTVPGREGGSSKAGAKGTKGAKGEKERKVGKAGMPIKEGSMPGSAGAGWEETPTPAPLLRVTHRCLTQLYSCSPKQSRLNRDGDNRYIKADYSYTHHENSVLAGSGKLRELRCGFIKTDKRD